MYPFRFFAERVINVWNYLPPSVSFSSLATFRRSIDIIDFTSFLADRTIGRAFGTVSRLSVVCPSSVRL